MIRTIWVYLNILLSVIVVGGAVVVRSLFPARSLGVYDWATRDWSRWILRVAGVQVQVEGIDNVRLDEPQIFASNHVSWFDVWTLAASIPKRNRFVAKKELEKIPLFGRAWKAAGHISVDRGDRSSAIRSLKQAGDRLHKDNISVVIYPEGTRSRTGEMGAFKKGAFMLALNAGVDIVPVAILGTRAIMAAGGWRIRPGRIILRFGEPVRTSDYPAARRDELIQEVRDRIQSMLNAPVEPA